MTAHTIPTFTGKIQGGQSETKYSQRVRCDLYAASRYDKRVKGIDRYHDDKALRDSVREVYDD